MKKTFTIIFLLNLVVASWAFAHQPRVVEERITIIENPEVSQAFYAELQGEPDFYKIVSEESFTLFVSITSPQVEGAHKDFNIEITKDGNFFLGINGEDVEWSEFHEPFGNDNYWQGPGLERNVEAGTYGIEVSRKTFRGKYVLVVGKKEEFPPKEIIKTIIALPQIKKFFGKSVFTAYFNIVGIFLAALIGLIVLVIFVIKKIIRKRGL